MLPQNIQAITVGRTVHRCDTADVPLIDSMVALAESCMADYDENGWTGPTWVNPDDVSRLPVGRARAAE